MIDLGTIAGLLEHHDELAAYCPKCERWRVMPPARLVANGKGSMRLPVKVRCIASGAQGRLQVCPPVPVLDPQRGGWISHTEE